MADTGDDRVDILIVAPAEPGGALLGAGVTESELHGAKEMAEAAVARAVSVTGRVVSVSAETMADKAVELSRKIVPPLRERLRDADNLDALEMSIGFTVSAEGDLKVASIGTTASLTLTFRC